VVVTCALAAFAHLNDLHIIDDQSPLRAEFLDRLADNGAQGYDTGSAYRPQEFLSTHLVDAMCRSIRQIGRGPRTALPLSFAIVTGDVVDNCQYIETRWYIGLLDGGHSIQADSGTIGKDESVSNRYGVDEALEVVGEAVVAAYQPAVAHQPAIMRSITQRWRPSRVDDSMPIACVVRARHVESTSKLGFWLTPAARQQQSGSQRRCRHAASMLPG
jgi:3',5'-cyclic AMP phosphodiesterase CpdA